jgi:signal transduction histidine kinase
LRVQYHSLLKKYWADVISLTGLLLGTRLSREQRDYVETIRDGGESLLSVINDILDFSKIDSVWMDLESSPFDLKSCIQDAVDLLTLQAAEKGLILDYSLDDGVPDTIIGDPTRLRQILANLLSNAVKFTDNGQIRILVSGKMLNGGGHEIEFAVQDTGIGIPKDKIGKLFRSFSHVDASTTRKYGGTGLGLAISKRLVELIEGGFGLKASRARILLFILQFSPRRLPARVSIKKSQ